MGEKSVNSSQITDYFTEEDIIGGKRGRENTSRSDITPDAKKAAFDSSDVDIAPDSLTGLPPWGKCHAQNDEKDDFPSGKPQ